MPTPSEDELVRRRRVYDQMCTMHGVLRDSASRKARALDILILLLTALVNGLTFADPSLFATFGWTVGFARLVLGGVAITAFGAALIAWRVDWKAMADRHDHAAMKCADLKAQAQALRSSTRPVDEGERDRFFRSADLIMGTLAKIPDREFLPLKARHQRKVAISRLLDRIPGAPVWWIHLLMTWRDMRRAAPLVRAAEDYNG